MKLSGPVLFICCLIGFDSGFYCSFFEVFFVYIHKEYCSVVFSSYVSCFGIYEALASWNELKSFASSILGGKFCECLVLILLYVFGRIHQLSYSRVLYVGSFSINCSIFLLVISIQFFHYCQFWWFVF